MQRLILFFGVVLWCAAVAARPAPAPAADNPFDRNPIHFTAIGDVSIAYQDMGPRDGEPVLLVMGLGAQMLHWGDTLVQGLLDAGYRVIVFDNRDAGLSQKFYELAAPPVWWTMLKDKVGLDPDPAYTLQDMAADAVGLLDELGIQRAHVVGASMGGMIAQVMAAEYPQRLRSLTSIMSSSGAPGLPESEPAAVEALASASEASPSRAARIDKGVEISRALGADETFDEAHARQMTKRVANRGGYAPGMVRQFQAIVASGDRSTLLREIRVPTLVIHGKADPLLPVAHGRDTADKVPGAEFAAIPEMGHTFDPTSSARVLEVLLPFLASPGQRPEN
ncbi:alpha/beta fold hydrolase [Microbulbifer yueqingensis]|uniref:Pimeloyl-ACP methyl ester carboxylesterase n=1 Tax=Microbulbifer yueqingensis TaxID=658219 RepID=A0A1G8W0K5_9GAMM|nr:alpha/beta hydrolase [Microbulbifer yueqingensis]SDJ71666.1 Pimeloyl-ACP methyl ester carboxylesterase [Microbulbifer yueqingensis]